MGNDIKTVESTNGFTDDWVKTWLFKNGEWVYYGLCKKRIAPITTDGEYTYFDFYGTKVRQQL